MKPVAWMDESGDVCSDITKKMYKGYTVTFNYDKYTIPLYAAPRELSDEEIMQIYESIWKGELTIEEINNSEIRFARAILKKASEK